MRTLSARWVAPAVCPPIADGVVSFDGGRITYVGASDGRPVDERFDDAVLLPGFVNAHTHLDLTGAAGQTPPGLPFPDWLRSVIAFRSRRDGPATAGDIGAGIRQSLAAGTTLVGDISAGGTSAAPIAASALRAAVFLELIGLTFERAADFRQRAGDWMRQSRPDDRVVHLLSPHAPYSFRSEALALFATWPRPTVMHFAESAEEIELLDHRAGPFVPFLESIGVYDPSGLPGSFDEAVRNLRRLFAPVLIHCNYLPPDAPLPPRTTIVYCPRTHAAFDHPPHPFREFLARRVRVVLGTDSLASNPDLSVLDEARFVARRYPDVDRNVLLKMITSWAAEALGWQALTGGLAIGRYADIAAVRLADRAGDPLDDLFCNQSPVVAVYAGGTRIA
jgi:cytosine/adenosine deaminase-related metal-dependent hydrolase